MAKDKKTTKNKDGNGHSEEEANALERYERIEHGEGMPPHYKVLFGQEGNELAEVSRLTDREKVLFAVQVMQEELANPKRKGRASRVFREQYMHNSIAVGGEGRKDIQLLGQQAMEAEAAKRGQGFG